MADRPTLSGRVDIERGVLRLEDAARTDGYQQAVNEVERALYGGESALYAWLVSARARGGGAVPASGGSSPASPLAPG